MEEAHDWDVWFRGQLDGGLAEDAPLTYKWTADKGHFVVRDANGNEVEASSATGLSATWVAPPASELRTESTSVEIKCTIDDAKGPRVGAREAGTRDDEVLERTVNVTVVSSQASVKLGVYKQVVDPNDQSMTYQKVSGTSGGTLYRALEVRVGRGLRVSSGKALVRLEETEQVNGKLHDDHERYIDMEVNFGLREGWQKQLASGEWVEAPEAPSAADSSEGEVRYRYLAPWNTASRQSGSRLEAGEMVAGALLGHNGSHEVSLLSVDDEVGEQVEFAYPGGDLFSAETPENLEVEVGNLVITDAKASDGNLDFVRLDKDSDNPSISQPSVSFRIDDESYEEGDSYFCVVAFPETNYAVMPTLVGTLHQPSTASFTIPQNAPRGVFGFSIIVKKSRGGQQIDQQFLRSQLVIISKTKEDLVGPDGQEKVNYSFHLAPINTSQAEPAPATVGVIYTIRAADHSQAESFWHRPLPKQQIQPMHSNGVIKLFYQR